MNERSTAEQFFAILVDAGVDPRDVEMLLRSPQVREYAGRIKPYIDLFAKEARAGNKAIEATAVRAS